MRGEQQGEKVMSDVGGKQYTGQLNKEQIAILHWFFQNSSSRISRTGGRTIVNAQLPFTFSWIPDRCAFRDWGEEEYYNCQKFAIVFHTNPGSILKHISKSVHDSDTRSSVEPSGDSHGLVSNSNDPKKDNPNRSRSNNSPVRPRSPKANKSPMRPRSPKANRRTR